jgi:hypothetical protein
MPADTTIPLTDETVERLYKHKKRGETWDDLIQRRALEDKNAKRRASL